jgi:hypothetical protein
MPADDAVLALSAVVTREGRVQNLELLEGDRPLRVKVRPDVLLAMLQAASQMEFEPAKATATGAPVAVSMVWVLANTTVKGQPTDDVILVRRPPTNSPPIERVAPARPVTPTAIARPVTEVSLL